MKSNKATNLSSNVLFHFTNSFENLISIIRNNFVPHYCPELFISSGQSIIGTELPQRIFPIVSFCDIPLALIREHLSHYGNYGIGLTKIWGIKNVVTPVSYFHRNSRDNVGINILQTISRAKKVDKDFNFLQHIALGEILIKRKVYSGYECRIIKNPTDKDFSLFVADNNGIVVSKYDNTSKDNILSNYSIWRITERLFYDEREWRYNIPFHSDVEKEKEKQYGITYKDYISGNYEFLKDYSLKFTTADIKFIIVNKDEEIPLFKKGISSMKRFNELELINFEYTPILSSESIRDNISI